MNTANPMRSWTRARALMCGASVAIIAAGAATVAAAQTQPATPATAAKQAKASGDSNQVSEVVVTGTSIRGVAPVGSTVISVGQDAIQKTSAQTVQQVLKSVPSVVGLGTAGQGSFGSADAAGVDAPTIHGLGASASNSTLILIDGHRIPLAGINHALADPNVLPPMALERVEVLADGASSVYGSDAVAGVINFISRNRFDGVEAQAQGGWGDHYHAYSAGVVAGKTWEGGGVLAAYGYSNRSDLKAGDRSFTVADKRAMGGSNLASFNCAPASIQPAGQSLVFLSPYNGTGIANTPANATCDYSGVADLLPKEERQNVMVKITQDITDRLSVNGDVVYSNLNDTTLSRRGTVTATVFGPGSANTSQINPFFVSTPGSTATAETIRWDADGLLGPGAHSDASEETFYVAGDVHYKITDDWAATLSGVTGVTNSRNQTIGALCTSCALLDLNGTTNANGSLTTPSIPGTQVFVTNTPLTAANALDVWGLGRSSSQVMQDLTSGVTTQTARHTLRDGTIKIEGPLFALPAGPVRLAAGGEATYYTMTSDVSRPSNTGPGGSASTNLKFDRHVFSGFAEVLAPLVSPDMNVPFVRRLDLDVSGRYDKYSDFGSTSNPKVGVNWEVIDALKLRASYAKSFVAPALTSRGDAFGITAESGFGGYGLGPVRAPLAAYPTLANVPGCSPTAATCTLGTTITGVQITGGNAALQPEKGKSWSFGADWRPDFIPGLRASVTYWHDEIQGAITAPTAAFAVNAPGLNSLLTIFPNGATPAQLAALQGNLPLTSSLPPTVYFAYNFQQRNALNLWVEGVDFDVAYAFDTSLGRLTVDALGSYKTKFDQQVGTGGAIFSVLNTTGFNTTFPSIQLETRASVSWESTFGLSATVFWNHSGSYHNWSGTTVTPITRDAGGNPVGGGDKVRAQDTFDLHAAYDFPGEGWEKGAQVYVDVQNVFDRDPPFYNNVNGFDTFSGNPIGRIVSVGARKRF